MGMYVWDSDVKSGRWGRMDVVWAAFMESGQKWNFHRQLGLEGLSADKTGRLWCCLACVDRRT